MVSAQAEKDGFEVKAGATLHQRYELEARIGEGGMGEVWRARDLSLKRQVAIKFLHGGLADKEETRSRFLVEAQVTAQLNSRYAVLVYDFGVTHDGQPYFVLELLHGETLARRIERIGKLDAETTVTILKKAARALTRAHALRIVHRDFKPDNVFLTTSEEGEGEEVKVVDFGIAKLIGNLEETRPSLTPETLPLRGLRSLTRTDAFVGTPQYMAPEQIRQMEVGPPVDVWALGAVAFECLTGVPAFAGNTVMDLFVNIQLGRSVSVRAIDPSIPEAFDAWFKRATAVAAEDRFSDPNQAAAELAAALLPMQATTLISADGPVGDVSPFATTASGTHTVSSESRPEAAPVPGFPRHRSLARILIPAFATIAIAIAAFMRLHAASPPSHVASPAAETHAESTPTFPPPPQTVQDSHHPPPPTGEERRGGEDRTTATPSVSAIPKSPPTKHPRTPHDAASTDPAPSKSTDAAPAPPPKPAASSSSPFTLPPLGL